MNNVQEIFQLVVPLQWEWRWSRDMWSSGQLLYQIWLFWCHCSERIRWHASPVSKLVRQDGQNCADYLVSRQFVVCEVALSILSLEQRSNKIPRTLEIYWWRHWKIKISRFKHFAALMSPQKLYKTDSLARLEPSDQKIIYWSISISSFTNNKNCTLY